MRVPVHMQRAMLLCSWLCHSLGPTLAKLPSTSTCLPAQFTDCPSSLHLRYARANAVPSTSATDVIAPSFCPSCDATADPGLHLQPSRSLSLQSLCFTPSEQTTGLCLQHAQELACPASCEKVQELACPASCETHGRDQDTHTGKQAPAALSAHTELWRHQKHAMTLPSNTHGAHVAYSASHTRLSPSSVAGPADRLAPLAGTGMNQAGCPSVQSMCTIAGAGARLQVQCTCTIADTIAGAEEATPAFPCTLASVSWPT
jgi:hypothetical protein